MTDSAQTPQPTDIGPDETDLDSDAVPETSDPAAFDQDETVEGPAAGDGGAG